MQASLLATALLMGLAGGPHCVAMCSAACSGVIRIARAPQAGAVAVVPMARSLMPALLFHAGRAGAYAAAGAVVAGVFHSLGWASDHVAALRPVWTLAHVFIFVWALMLAFSGRQPVWVDRVGRSLSDRLRPWVGSPFGVFASGALWVLLPCGLLYSALMVAALGSGPVDGALLMLAFALGSGAWLVLAPWLWTQLQGRINGWRRDWGTRVAGVLLAVVAGRALWMDVWHQIEIWCQ